jgi:trehalose/maltose hydrolase-like predicted phosphorylase
VLAMLPASRRRALRTRLGITDAEIERWNEMTRLMYVPTHASPDGSRVISQFEGYESLEELDWDAYREKHTNIQRMDRILKAEGDDPDRYKVAKQADAVMLFFLFSADELREILGRLGYDDVAGDPDLARRTIDYYDHRTSHGSTLSLVAHAAVLAGIDPESSWERFLVALESDVGDVQGGTTKEGIHMGVMSGTLDLLQRAYVGCSVHDGVLHFAPRLTTRLDGLRYSMVFQGTGLHVAVTDGELVVEVATEGFSHPVKIGIGGEIREMGAGERASVRLADDPSDITAPAADGDEHVLVGQGRAERRGTVQNGRSEQ